jgi:hypothetical protein
MLVTSGKGTAVPEAIVIIQKAKHPAVLGGVFLRQIKST